MALHIHRFTDRKLLMYKPPIGAGDQALMLVEQSCRCGESRERVKPAPVLKSDRDRKDSASGSHGDA